MIVALDLAELRSSLMNGEAYALVVPSSMQRGLLEDVCLDLRRNGIEVAGYDVYPEERGCRVVLRARGECMVDADLDHVDVRLHTVGECIDYHVEEDPNEDHGLAIFDKDADRPAAILAWAEAFLPRRYTNEEFGDALEEIRARQQRGCSRWWVRLKIVMTILWVVCHVLVEEYARYRKKLK